MIFTRHYIATAIHLHKLASPTAQQIKGHGVKVKTKAITPPLGRYLSNLHSPTAQHCTSHTEEEGIGASDKQKKASHLWLQKFFFQIFFPLYFIRALNKL